MAKLEKLTKNQERLMYEIRDEWINLSLRGKIDKEEVESGVKWIYYASNLKEPEVVFVEGPEDFVKKLGVGSSVRSSVRSSVWASVRSSVWDSVWDSVGSSVSDSVRSSVWDSVGSSVSYMCLSCDAEFGAWYEFYKNIGIVNNEKINKYIGYLKGGVFYAMFFEKKAFIMCPPQYVEQDDRKRLHSEKQAAFIFKDGTELYMIHGVKFEKEWWSKIVNDELSPEEILAIDNMEHRRIAWEYMNKKKLEGLKHFKVLDEVENDGKGYKMRIVQFIHPDVGEIRYYNCFCPTTGREYYIGTEETTCLKAKTKSFGLEEIEFMPVNEWNKPNYWLSCIKLTGKVRPLDVIEALEKENIESRPLRKPMHLQPFYANCDYIGQGFSETLFENGLCLPSDTKMTDYDLVRVVKTIRRLWE